MNTKLDTSPKPLFAYDGVYYYPTLDAALIVGLSPNSMRKYAQQHHNGLENPLGPVPTKLPNIICNMYSEASLADYLSRGAK